MRVIIYSSVQNFHCIVSSTKVANKANLGCRTCKYIMILFNSMSVLEVDSKRKLLLVDRSEFEGKKPKVHFCRAKEGSFNHCSIKVVSSAWKRVGAFLSISQSASFQRNMEHHSEPRHHEAVPQEFSGFAAFRAHEEVKPYKYTPKPMGDCDVDIKISHCGMCSSDLHQMDSGWEESKYPMIPGASVGLFFDSLWTIRSRDCRKSCCTRRTSEAFGNWRESWGRCAGIISYFEFWTLFSAGHARDASNANVMRNPSVLRYKPSIQIESNLFL